MDGQFSFFDYTRPMIKIDKPIRLIELFAGVGSQAMALRNLGANFEHYRVVEFDKYAIASYNAIHGTNFDTTDIKDIKGLDLGITDVERFTYLLTYLLLSMHRFVRGWKTDGYGKRFGYTFRTLMGS